MPDRPITPGKDADNAMTACVHPSGHGQDGWMCSELFAISA
jgi:hypothetical protein